MAWERPGGVRSGSPTGVNPTIPTPDRPNAAHLQKGLAMRTDEENRETLAAIQQILFPDGDPEHEWDGNTIERVSETLTNAGWGEPYSGHPIANAGDHDWNESLFLFQFGDMGGCTWLYVWGSDAGSALEEASEWLDDNAPGRLVKVGRNEFFEAALELGINEPAFTWYDDAERWSLGKEWEQIREKAETDLTLVGGHTQLKNGDYLNSAEWHVNDVLVGTDEYRATKAESALLSVRYVRRR